jgi:hypothetical protein
MVALVAPAIAPRSATAHPAWRRLPAWRLAHLDLRVPRLPDLPRHEGRHGGSPLASGSWGDRRLPPDQLLWSLIYGFIEFRPGSFSIPGNMLADGSRPHEIRWRSSPTSAS